MAQLKAELREGPCAGKVVKITQAQLDSGETICKDAVYKLNENVPPDNNVYTFDYDHTIAKPGGGAKSPHAHGGWKDLQHSVNRNMPRSLRASRRSLTAALRELNRARKVRIR